MRIAYLCGDRGVLLDGNTGSSPLALATIGTPAPAYSQTFRGEK